MASSLISCSILISLNCKSPAQNRKTSLSGRKLRSESGGGGLKMKMKSLQSLRERDNDQSEQEGSGSEMRRARRST